MFTFAWMGKKNYVENFFIGESVDSVGVCEKGVEKVLILLPT